jgi:hypothetical protein
MKSTAVGLPIVNVYVIDESELTWGHREADV